MKPVGSLVFFVIFLAGMLVNHLNLDLLGKGWTKIRDVPLLRVVKNGDLP